MQYLWTPWRMAYIAGSSADSGHTEDSGEGGSNPSRTPNAPQMESTGCVFCDRVRLPEAHDRASLILLRAERNFAILNLYPYNSAHLMVMPYTHTADFANLEAETLNQMTALVQLMVRAIDAEYKPEGYNIGMNLGRIAGAGVADHLHVHVVPRWAGDTNFMPVVGSTKVMPELLETTYDRLKARLESVI